MESGCSGPWGAAAHGLPRRSGSTFELSSWVNARRRAKLRRELERERVLVTAFPQTDARMIPASDRLYRAVVEKRLTVPDHDELRQQAANTIMRNSRRGARLDKPSLDLPNATRSSRFAWRSRRSRTSPSPCR